MMNRMNEIIPETKKESRILREVTGKRTKNTKYFATEDHGGIAAVSPGSPLSRSGRVEGN